MRELDKFLGCIIGGAIGDALGYSVEFLLENQIFEKYGSSGITNYDLTNGVAQISDDTQMTLFTANGLLFGTTRGRMRGIIGSYKDYIREMYKCWYRTQKEKYPLKDENKISWLLNVSELFERRAPGMTCLSAIQSGAEGTINKPINSSKGCGGIMRVAPIGIYFSDSIMSYRESDMIGAEVAALTHGHELGYIPSAALVHIVRKLSEDGLVTPKNAVIESIFEVRKMFPETENMSKFVSLMNCAIELSESNIDDLDAIHQLGEGWVAEETLAIAAYCAMKYSNDFEKAVVTAVNHNGDSDSTGAVLGNILGTYVGFSNIPDKYKSNLELMDVLYEISEDLYNDCQMSEYSDFNDEKWSSKYISASYSK